MMLIIIKSENCSYTGDLPTMLLNTTFISDQFYSNTASNVGSELVVKMEQTIAISKVIT